VIRLAKRYTTWAENPDVPFPYYVGIFLSLVTLRNFVEVFSDRTEVSAHVHVHYSLFHVCAALVMVLLFSLATRDRTDKTARVVLASYYVVLLAPLFDLLVSGGAGHDISYLLPGRHDDLLARFLTYGGSLEEGGITIGLRLEGAVVLTCSYLYFRAKRVSIARSLVFLLLIYVAFFTLAMLPFLIQAPLQALGLLESLTDEALFIKANLVLGLALLAAVASRWERVHSGRLVKGWRPYRQAHALLMFALGMSLTEPLQWKQSTPFDLILVAASIFSACLFVITIGDLEDSPDGDPAPPDEDTLRQRRWLAISAALVALGCAGVVSYELAFLILLAMGLYCIYTSPPVSLKRVFMLSKVPVALASLAAVLMGYVFGGSGIAEVNPLIVLWFLLPFALALNLIDLKDYGADKASGSRTLPVRLGFRRGQYVVAALVLLAYGTAPPAFDSPGLVLPALVVGAIQFAIVTRRDYREQPVLGLYLASLVVLVAASALAMNQA
jgi:4-hydroxybenzoate polyprenyltransferase